MTAALAVPLAVALGLVCALKPNGAVDRAISSVSLTLISVPDFLVAILLVTVFAVHLGWLPAIANLRPGLDATAVARMLVLPVTVLLFTVLAHMVRMTRTTVINILVSHDLAVVAQLVDQVLVLRDDVMVELNAAEEIIARPAETSTRQLIGAAHVMPATVSPGRAPPDSDGTGTTAGGGLSVHLARHLHCRAGRRYHCRHAEWQGRGIRTDRDRAAAAPSSVHGASAEVGPRHENRLAGHAGAVGARRDGSAVTTAAN